MYEDEESADSSSAVSYLHKGEGQLPTINEKWYLLSGMNFLSPQSETRGEGYPQSSSSQFDFGIYWPNRTHQRMYGFVFSTLDLFGKSRTQDPENPDGYLSTSQNMYALSAHHFWGGGI